ncbi:hypothetical protein NQ318_021210 [Aromia moschata]|uniref:Uncharacterized protein n=1 Tax=Aromia moschata TaxID=1265417 RepID=A0AAV8X2C5_9CUCU|nr:hypothetical protein NQ318_021210 [Aromia moschata]
MNSFRLLSLRKFPKSRKKPNPMEQMPDDDRNKMLFDEVHAALQRPGPDLVICDEGHRINKFPCLNISSFKADGNKEKSRFDRLSPPKQLTGVTGAWSTLSDQTTLEFQNRILQHVRRPIMDGWCIVSTEADMQTYAVQSSRLAFFIAGLRTAEAVPRCFTDSFTAERRVCAFG